MWYRRFLVKTRKFGSLDFYVSEIAFGGAAISGEGGGYGFGGISEKESIDLLHACFDAGINIYDTAPVYGFGESERRIGKAFHNRRDDVFLVSKSGVTWNSSKRIFISNDLKTTQMMLHRSLKDLKTDYIDLYMIHWPDSKVDIREPMKALSRAKKEGKIRFIGLSNPRLEDLKKAEEVDRVQVVQDEFNFFKDDLRETLFPLIREHNYGLMTWGTLGKGVLTGRVARDRKFDPSDCRSWAPWWKTSYLQERIDGIEKFQTFLKIAGISGLQAALGFNLGFPEVSAAICGIRNLDQLQSLLATLNSLPSPQKIKELRAEFVFSINSK